MVLTRSNSSGLQPRRRVAEPAEPLTGGGSSSSSSLRRGASKIPLRRFDGAPEVPALLKALKKDLKGTARAFWEALKFLATQSYGNAEGAYRKHSDEKDGLMAFNQFQELCDDVGLSPVPAPTLRALFDAHRDPEEGAWSARIFMDVLLVKRIDRIRGKLQEYNKGLARMHGHADSFIRMLCLHSGDEGRHRSLLRFQQKLTIPFCTELYTALKRMQMRWADSDLRRAEAAQHIDCATLLRTVGAVCQQSTFQAYEMDFLANIFDRIDRGRTGRVSTIDLAVSMALLAAEASRFDKARFLFFVFDDDEDGCLNREQILRMYCCAAIHGVIARGDQSAYDADILLGDELSLSKARRLYDYTALQMAGGGMEDLCTFQELWPVWEAHPMLLEELMPGSHSITWVLRPVAGAQAQKNHSAVRQSPTKRKPTMSSVAATAMKTVQFAQLANDAAVAARCAVDGSSSPQALKRSPANANFTEWFRKTAAVRFRHAVRGEWDAVDAIQESMQDSSGSPEQSPRQLHLPPLVGGGVKGSMSATVSAQAKFVEAGVRSFERRQQKGKNWNDVHRSTLNGWAKGFNIPKGETGDEEQDDDTQEVNDATMNPQGRTLVTSQSLPSLAAVRNGAMAGSGPALATTRLQAPGFRQRGAGRRNVRDCATTAADPAHLLSKVAQAAAEAQAPEAVPIAEAGKHRYGHKAMRRFRCFSEVKACSRSKLGDLDPLKESVEYDCQLCKGRHGVAVGCTS